jgi:hypothetical protein
MMKQMKLTACVAVCCWSLGGATTAAQDAEQATQQGLAANSTPKKIQAPEEPVRWPMRLAKNRPVPVIEAQVNGQGPFLFFFDTGASVATLDTGFIKKLALNSKGKTTIRGPSGPGIEADVVDVKSLEIGGVLFEDFEAVAFDRSQYAGGEEIVGSLGLPMFGELPATIDYPNSELVFGGEGLPEPDERTVFACDFSGQIPAFQIQLGELEFKTHFDTGSGGFLVVGKEIADKLQFQGEPTVVGRGRGVSGEFEIRAATLDGNLKVGEHVTQSPTVMMMPQSDLCFLGHPWAKEFAITFDRSKGRIRFVKPDSKQ